MAKVIKLTGSQNKNLQSIRYLTNTVFQIQVFAIAFVISGTKLAQGNTFEHVVEPIHAKPKKLVHVVHKVIAKNRLINTRGAALSKAKKLPHPETLAEHSEHPPKTPPKDRAINGTSLHATDHMRAKSSPVKMQEDLNTSAPEGHHRAATTNNQKLVSRPAGSPPQLYSDENPPSVHPKGYTDGLKAPDKVDSDKRMADAGPFQKEIKPPSQFKSRPQEAYRNNNDARNSGFHGDLQLGRTVRDVSNFTKAAKLETSTNPMKVLASKKAADVDTKLRNDSRALVKTQRETTAWAEGSLRNGDREEAFKSTFLADRANKKLKEVMPAYSESLNKLEEFHGTEKYETYKGEKDQMQHVANSDDRISKLKEKLGPENYNNWVKTNRAQIEKDEDRTELTGKHGATAVKVIASSILLAPIAPALAPAVATAAAINIGANAFAKTAIAEGGNLVKKSVRNNETLSDSDRQTKIDKINTNVEVTQNVRKVAHSLGSLAVGGYAISSAVQASQQVSGGGLPKTVSDIKTGVKSVKDVAPPAIKAAQSASAASELLLPP